MKNFWTSSLIFFLMLNAYLSACAYSNFSPYSYCAGNPIKYIDPTGEDVVVLNLVGNPLKMHMAMLLQNEEGKWEYFSVNGDNVYLPVPISLAFPPIFVIRHMGGRPFDDIAVGSWNSPEEFLNSTYNVKTKDGKEDKSENHYGFTEGYLIHTTPEQDAIMRDSFVKKSKTSYNLFFNNCATAVQQALLDAGIPISEPTRVPYTQVVSTPFGLIEVYQGEKIDYDMYIIPSRAYKSIQLMNPDGVLIRK